MKKTHVECEWLLEYVQHPTRLGCVHQPETDLGCLPINASIPHRRPYRSLAIKEATSFTNLQQLLRIQSIFLK